MLDAQIVSEVSEDIKAYTWSLEKIRALEIQDQTDYELATELAKNAHDNWKRLDKRRTDITKPILASKRSIDALFEPALRILATIREELKTKIGVYTSSQRTAQREAMQEAANQFAAGLVPSNPIPEAPQAKGVSVTEVWDFEITDPDKVPREYCSPDPAKIKAAIWYADTPKTPPQSIPGISFSLKVNTIIRTNNK